MRRALLALVPALCLAADTEWRTYGHDDGGNRHSPLKQIDRTNVAKLTPAWTFRTRELDDAPDDPNHRQRVTAFESTPLVIDGVLYFSTPGGRVIALNPETGKPIWDYDTQPGTKKRRTHQHRGIAYWPGAKRLFSGTMDGKLIALDATTGKPATNFADNGILDLRAGIADRWPKAAYSLNSPPAIFENLVIVGAEVPEGFGIGPAGSVRAFDASTGKLVWTFHTIPQPGEFGHDTWEGDGWKDRTGANVWSMMSVDAKRGLVFLPIGSASYDFYGGDRPGNNLFANSVVALDARTGKRVWHQQLIHHDLWDYDLPAMPMLLRIGGKDAVVQVTKSAFVFVFDRATGKPLFPIEERPVPQSEVPGEKTSPTQPFPVKPPPLARTQLTANDLSTVTPEAAKFCKDLFAKSIHKGIFTPWSDKQMTIAMPGTLGGATWSGGSYDESTGMLYVNVNEFGAVGMLQKQPEGSASKYLRWSPGGAYARFGTEELWPCTQPPWGTLQAIDLRKGEIAWKVPLGITEKLEDKGIHNTGAPNIGGSIFTDGGLVFIAATNDSRFRAFDARNGKELWTAKLPSSGHATPITYMGKNGKQYVVIAAGGGGFFGSEGADALVAYALP